jgi:hypothetical protein
VRRDSDRQNRSPILRDLVRGSGGYGSGWFDMVGGDTYTLTYVQDSGTAQAGSSSGITLRSGASSTTDAYAGMSIQLTGGTGSGDDTKQIAAYNGSTKVATILGTWSTNPDSTTTYQVVSRAY